MGIFPLRHFTEPEENVRRKQLGYAAIVICVSTFLFVQQLVTEAALKSQESFLYHLAPRPLETWAEIHDPDAVSLSGMDVWRDADIEYPPPNETAVVELPPVFEGQFLRVNRIHQRRPPRPLTFKMFDSGGFDGDVVMTRGKYNWLRFGTPVRVPRATIDCAIAERAPLSCDAEARAVGIGRSSSVVATTERKWLATLPDRDPFMSVTSRWKSCALVSNSGALLLENRGREIDHHDAVFRLNDGPTRGFEKFVGTKTTVRVLGPSHLGFREERAPGRESHSSKEKLLQIVLDSGQMAALNAWRLQSPLVELHIVDGDFHEFVLDQALGNSNPSAGFYALVLASLKCDAVALYGFRQAPHKAHPHYKYFKSKAPLRHLRGADDAESAVWARFLARHPTQFAFAVPSLSWQREIAREARSGLTKKRRTDDDFRPEDDDGEEAMREEEEQEGEILALDSLGGEGAVSLPSGASPRGVERGDSDGGDDEGGATGTAGGGTDPLLLFEDTDRR